MHALHALENAHMIRNHDSTMELYPEAWRKSEVLGRIHSVKYSE
jgi:hypothetical protein